MYFSKFSAKLRKFFYNPHKSIRKFDYKAIYCYFCMKFAISTYCIYKHNDK